MPANKKPRKPHKSKPCGLPLTRSQRTSLELATRMEIDSLYRGRLTETGWHTLAAHFSVLSVSLGSRFEQAMHALQAIAERAKRTHKWGATGDERRHIIQAYNDSISNFLRLSDDTIRRALNKTMDKLQ